MHIVYNGAGLVLVNFLCIWYSVIMCTVVTSELSQDFDIKQVTFLTW